MILEFHGAARTVTGSMHLLQINGKNVLLDCGMFQGKRADANERNRNFPFDPRSIDAIILSHAHIDHSGNIPGIVRQGFSGKVYCTPATLDLCSLMLADSGHIQEKDAEYLNRKNRRHGEPPVVPLYTAEDGVTAMRHFIPAPYEKPFEVVPGLTAQFVDAGHILGSAAMQLTLKENGKTVILGFTGDIGRWGSPLMKDPSPAGAVDLLISESTYGGIINEGPGNMEQLLAADLKKTIARGGKIIVPCFSVGRTQELVYAMHDMWDRGELPPIPVYVDSPLAVNATEIFKKHPECFDEETWTHLNQHHDPFGFNRLSYVRTAEESKNLNSITDPCMIISASGMCEAGRILHHLVNNIGDEKNTILIVGYQAENTLGRRLVDGETEVRILGGYHERRAEVIVHNGFSAHADGSELVRYIGLHDRSRLKQVCLVHGEPERSEKLQDDLRRQGYDHITIPSAGEKINL